MNTSRRTYLYSVGVDDYSEFRPLAYCSADAVAVSQELGEKLKTQSVSLLTSQTGKNSTPSIASVRRLLSDIRNLKLNSNDSVFFYFAGHGFSASGRDYLVCSDTSRDALDAAVSTDDVISALMASSAGTNVLIIDACRSETERDVGPFGESTFTLAQRRGTVVFFGCSPGQTCQELPKLGHGVFTYALLSAVRDKNPCTPTDLDRRLGSEVEKLCSSNHLPIQRPYTCVAPLQKASVDLFTGLLVPYSRRNDRECLLIVGPSNAGKTTLAQRIANSQGMVHIEMSSFAYKRYQDHRKETHFPGSVQDFMEDVAWASGQKEVIASDLVSADPGTDRVVICGPRTVEEVNLLRTQNWNCKTIYLYANGHARYDRYCASGEGNRYGLGYREFVSKDMREYGWGLAKAANLRDVDIVVNEGSIDALVQQVTLRLRDDRH